MTTPTIQSTEAQSAIGVLQAMLLGRIARTFINDLLTDKQLPASVNKNVIRQTIDAIDKLQREVSRSIPKAIPYLENRVSRDKIIDIATVIELMVRVGTEERPAMYEDLMGLMVDGFDNVLYAQKHRKSIYFGKYKALYELISNEIRNDVNKQPSQVQYIQGELFLRTAVPPHNHKMK